MSLIITDINADEYLGYEIVGFESEAEEEQNRLERQSELDSLLGVVNEGVECTCALWTAGDHDTFESCERHGLASGTFPECCYCSDPKECNCWSEMTEKQHLYRQYVEDSRY